MVAYLGNKLLRAAMSGWVEGAAWIKHAGRIIDMAAARLRKRSQTFSLDIPPSSSSNFLQFLRP